MNGEKVELSLSHREHADVYDLTVILKTPKADRQPRASYVSLFDDYLINGGPAKDSGWTIDYKPGAAKYEFLRRGVGAFALTPKLRKALIDAEMWGKHPFNSYIVDASYAAYVADAVKDLVKDEKLKPSDVIGFGVTFSCTKNK